MDEKWIRILETNKEDKILEYLKNEFDKNNIKYKIDLEEKWVGSIRTPKYIGKIIIYVQEEFSSKVEEILNQYYEKNLVSSEEIEPSEESEGNMEIESQKISRKQTIMIRIFLGIIMCMTISIIIIGIINS